MSVGALRSDGNGRACFSAYGTTDDDWVSVYALGERHINAFASGGYAYVDRNGPTSPAATTQKSGSTPPAPA